MIFGTLPGMDGFGYELPDDPTLEFGFGDDWAGVGRGDGPDSIFFSAGAGVGGSLGKAGGDKEDSKPPKEVKGPFPGRLGPGEFEQKHLKAAMDMQKDLQWMQKVFEKNAAKSASFTDCEKAQYCGEKAARPGATGKDIRAAAYYAARCDEARRLFGLG